MKLALLISWLFISWSVQAETVLPEEDVALMEKVSSAAQKKHPQQQIQEQEESSKGDNDEGSGMGFGWNYHTEKASQTKTAFLVEEPDLYIETELINHDEDIIQKNRSLDYFKTHISLPATETAKVELELESFRDMEADSDFLNTHLRFRQFLLNHSSGLSISLMPQLSLPTTRVEVSQLNVKPGFAIPVDYSFSSAWSAGFKWFVEQARDVENSRWQRNFTTTIYLSYQFLDNLSTYIELYNERSDGLWNEPYSSADIALHYQATAELKISAGTYLDISGQVANNQPFIGASLLF